MKKGEVDNRELCQLPLGRITYKLICARDLWVSPKNYAYNVCMRNPINFDWIKPLAENMDAKTSLGAVLVIGIVMVGLFGGSGGLLLGTFLVTPLTIIIVGIFQDRTEHKPQKKSLRVARRAKPKLITNEEQHKLRPD